MMPRSSEGIRATMFSRPEKETLPIAALPVLTNACRMAAYASAWASFSGVDDDVLALAVLVTYYDLVLLDDCPWLVTSVLESYSKPLGGGHARRCSG
jgi:hypothetical protein